MTSTYEAWKTRDTALNVFLAAGGDASSTEYDALFQEVVDARSAHSAASGVSEDILVSALDQTEIPDDFGWATRPTETGWELEIWGTESNERLDIGKDTDERDIIEWIDSTVAQVQEETEPHEA